ncbi:hypothetical protein FB45DRAFT_912729 [Roridomyces roridus]|uniref:Uncharacterized protein n=1 Tax=Roridomyces roridus TaxID=1738132 RepID=A0AAD7FQG7_9AGAR|nr:hypothetical protein FB45DRAFT_912729 [Roridomyces roridus]
MLSRRLSTWFVDSATTRAPRHLPPHLNLLDPPPVPEDAPQPIKDLHAQLIQSPLLDPTALLVSQPRSLPPGPALPHREPRGRRNRGGTYPGESAFEVPGSLWSWIVMAQVKEGTENKGSIESVVRVVRKTLLEVKPPLPIPANSKQRMHNGWAMVDAGSFAVHILSKEAKSKFFPPDRYERWS